MKAFTRTLFIVGVIATLFSSCVINKPAGNWDYSVTGTPQGDYSGILIVSSGKEGYTAKLTGATGDVPFEKFVWDKKQSKATGNFYFSGIPLTFSATIDKDNMKGNISTGDMEFPLNANRKK